MQNLISYLQLCRFAAVFTAMADIFLGYLLTQPDLSPSRDFGLLLAASSGLYLAGMVFNDIFDRNVDARERPNRPIPSGRVSLQGAAIFGAVLLAIGLVAAGLVGKQSAFVATYLVGAIFLYDGLLKPTPLGPVAMGACRFLNVMLGASTAIDPSVGGPTNASVWGHPQLHVALGLGIYIAGVTWFARKEAGTSSRWQLAGALGVINLGVIFLAAFVLHWNDPDMIPRSWNAALILAAIGVIINHRLARALVDPAPAKVQLSVRTLLMSLVMLDASIVFFVNENRLYAFAVVLLLVPAQALARFLAVT
ncbi:MAG TPA: UbiA family prenyltransferase [Planctomycetaceae bacterium]|nr:UbiA family prenyltransferase [Planctomycetaceae bacterium]